MVFYSALYPVELPPASRSEWSRTIDLPRIRRTFYQLNYTSLIGNVGFEPRFCVPGAACCHYTTFSRKRLQRGAARPVDERLAPVLVPSGHRLAPTEPAGETRSEAKTEPVSSDKVSRAHRVRKLLAHRARDRQSGVLAFILWSLIFRGRPANTDPPFSILNLLINRSFRQSWLQL